MMNNRNYYTITLSLLGVAKLVLNAFNIDILTNQQMNEIANGIATLITVGGVLMTHLKNRPKLDPQQLKQVATDIVKEASK